MFPFTQTGVSIHYGVPFGANAADNILPQAGTHASDEIPYEDWKRSRHIHDWIHGGTTAWGLTIASDHQQVRLYDNVISAEMVRGTRFTSVKVVRGAEITSLHYPPPGVYLFRYSLSSAAGDWMSAKAYRLGMDWTNPLLPISVVDAISKKSLPPARSLASIAQDNVVISALKKADLGPSLLLRVYEIEGALVETPLEIFGVSSIFTEVNLLEEDLGQPPQRLLRAGPYAIKTLKFIDFRPGSH